MSEGEIKPILTSKKITIPVIHGSGVPFSSPHRIHLSKVGHQIIVDTNPSIKQNSLTEIGVPSTAHTQFTKTNAIDTLLKPSKSKKIDALHAVNFFHKDTVGSEIYLDKQGFIEDAIASAVTEYESRVPENIKPTEPAKAPKHLSHP